MLLLEPNNFIPVQLRLSDPEAKPQDTQLGIAESSSRD